MVLEGATPRQVDTALEDWGMAMGILAVFDMAGIDVGVNVHKANASRYPPDPAYYQADFALVRSRAPRPEERQGLLPIRAGQSRAHRRPRGASKSCAARAQELKVPQRVHSAAEIQERCLFPLLNEGFRVLGEGIAMRAADIDVVWTSGYGFPRYRGGPMFYAEIIGLKTLLDGMRRYRDIFGAMHWEPAPLLVELVDAGTEHRGVGTPAAGEGGAAMNVKDLIAIDVHTHAEVSCRHEPDEAWKPFEDASAKYFKAGKRPTIPETIAYYRERKIGLVMFTVDSEFEIGARRIPNEEVADAARENADIMMAFASIDPHKGKMGVREARRLIKDGVIRGFKFHPTLQGFFPNDRIAYPLYEVIAEHKLPAIFHSGHSGMGTGMPGGGGLRLKYSNPIHLDDVAADFPDMTIIIAHPVLALAGRGAVGVPAQAQRLHRSVGLVAEIFSAAARAIREHAAQDAHVVRLGLSTDHAGSLDQGFPAKPGFKPEVHDLILKQNAIRALGLERA